MNLSQIALIAYLNEASVMAYAHESHARKVRHMITKVRLATGKTVTYRQVFSY